MTATTDYRLDGIYKQRQDGFSMQRVKLAAGVISSEQALCVAQLAERHGRGVIHLTSRGSMEIHWLKEEELPLVKKSLASVGLTSRGACGGAVRGITCSSQAAQDFPQLETLARRIHRHFTANPRFERLPKKFKIGIEADTSGRRHLIQDVGLVLADGGDGTPRYDVYVAGGLGREPQAGLLLESGVSENRIIPLVEAIARVYAAHTPAGKRLKHLLREIGEERFRTLLQDDPGSSEELPAVSGLAEACIAPGNGTHRITAYLPDGVLDSSRLKGLAVFACHWSNGFMMVTANQDIALHCSDGHDFAQAGAALAQLGFPPPEHAQVTFRVCPGAHECRMGLALTRDISQALTGSMGPAARALTWALSGCPNSCTQPQLADAGIVIAGARSADGGERTPYFDVYRPDGAGLNRRVAQGLGLDELTALITSLG